MRLVLALIALGIVAAVPANANAQSWEEYRPDGGGFRVEMPGTPKLETKQSKAGNPDYYATVAFQNMAFLAVYSAVDDNNPADSEILLDAVVQGMSEGKKLLSSKKEMIGGYPARRVLFEDTDKDHFEARVVITGKRLIQALFVGPRGNPLGQRFLDSFALVEPKWTNETLLAGLPDGYKRDFEQKTNESLISEMVPVGQSVSNWTEMVTVQVFYTLKTTPQQFKAQMDKERAAACPGSETQPVTQGDENGYPSMVWLQNCPLNKATGKPEITWFKAIAGNDSFYVVQVAFKAWPSKELIAQWMHYLKDVRVCDTRLPERPCAMPAAAASAPVAALPVAPAAAAPSPAATAAAALAAAAAAPTDRLTGRAAWNQLVGNSIIGDDDGETLVEYYAADGTSKSMSGNKISIGRWTFGGERVCFKYTDEPRDCYKVEVSGDAVTFYDKDRSGLRYTLLKGNPKKL
jgi:hypothetical protein